MKLRPMPSILTGLLIAGLAACLQAQEKRASPHETAKGTIDGVQISIEYGRPYVKGRKIWGGLNPNAQVWRLGADEATTMTTSGPLTIGSVAVPAGKHTLYMWVDESQPKLIINKQTGQWGTDYDEKQDLGRVDLQKATAGKLEQLTISVDSKAGGGGALKIAWDDREYTATVKK
jgi:hypothetical protein